jgi:paraquat-inducible protein B
VELKGLKVGSVSDFRLEIDPKTMAVRIPVTVEIDPQRILTAAELDQLMQATGYAATSPERRPGMEKLVERGLRAQLKTGSLLTGQLYVDLDFYPASPPAKLIYGGQYPEIPTVPTALEEFQDSAAAILANLKKLPLDKIGNELALTLQSANRLISDPNLKDTLRSLDVVLKDVQKLAQTADRQVAALATGTEKTLMAVRAVLENVEPGAPVAVDLANTLEELAAAARSMRVLSNYLERHPEALLYGKGGPGDKP